MLMTRVPSRSRAAVVVHAILSLFICLAAGSATAQPLRIKKQGTDQVCCAYHRQPLLSFGNRRISR